MASDPYYKDNNWWWGIVTGALLMLGVLCLVGLYLQ
jgi:hypothetical protein